MRKKLLILEIFGCLVVSTLFCFAVDELPLPSNEVIPSETVFPTSQPHSTESPHIKNELPAQKIEDEKEGDVKLKEDESINELIVGDNPYTVDDFVDNNGINWQRLPESEQLFQALKMLGYGVNLNVSIQGTRIGKYQTPKFGYLTKFNANDGYTYYCIDPYTLFVKGDGYVGSEIDFNKIPFEKLLRIAKYISYGYMYQDFTSDNYFIATQLLIWEELGYYVSGITDMNNNPIDVSNEKANIIATMEAVKIQPSFNDAQLTCEFDKECRIEDTNHVLGKYYEIDWDATSKHFSKGYPYIDGDYLVLKSDQIWETNKQVAVKSKLGGYNESVKGMLLMTKPGSQDMLAGRLSDPIFDAVMHMDLKTHDLVIEKYDEYGNKAEQGTQFQIAYDEFFQHLIVPNCDMNVISEEDSRNLNYSQSCEVFNEKSQKFDTVDAKTVWTLGSDGRLVIEDILPYNAYSKNINTEKGKFWIREVSTTNPYQLNSHAYPVDLSQASQTIPFVNLLRDVSLNIFKKDSEEQFRYLNGAKWEIYEVVDDATDYENNVQVGPQQGYDYPFQYPTIDTKITYDELVGLVGILEEGKYFITNDLLWKILSIDDDHIELGYLSNVTPSEEITFDMIPNDITFEQTFNRNGKDYTYLGKTTQGVYLKKDEQIIWVPNASSLAYEDVINLSIDEFATVKGVKVQLKNINDYQANVDIFEMNQSEITEDSKSISLESILQTYASQYPNDVDGKIDDNTKLLLNNHEVVLSNIVYDSDNLESLVLSYEVKSSIILTNEWVKYSDINFNKDRTYEYTLKELIPPTYTMVSNEGDSIYHNQRIIIEHDKLNDYLNFNEIEAVYPWQQSMIRVGDTMNKSYELVIQNAIDLSMINQISIDENNQFVLDEITYIVDEVYYVEVDNQKVIEKIIFHPLEDSSISYTVDQDNTVPAIRETIEVTWRCEEIKAPEIIAKFDNADAYFFEQFPIHKDRIVHFISDSNQSHDQTFIDADTDTNGVIDINHGRYEERTYTHPVTYREITHALQLSPNDSFSVTKEGVLHINEMIEVNGINAYVSALPITQEYLTLIYSLQVNAPSYLQILQGNNNGSSIDIEGDIYQIIDNIQEENIFSIKDEQGVIYRYWIKTIHKTSQENIEEKDFNTNTICIDIPNPWGLSYEKLVELLNQQNIDIIHVKVGDTLNLSINNSEYHMLVVNHVVNGNDSSVTLQDQNGHLDTLKKRASVANPVVDKYFIPLNKPINLKEFFNSDADTFYTIKTPYLNKQYQATIHDNVITATKLGVFEVIASRKSAINDLSYLAFKDLKVNDTKIINGQSYTVNNVDESKVEVVDEVGNLHTLYAKAKLTLDILTEINKTIPLFIGSHFTYENNAYQIQSVTFDNGMIIEASVLDLNKQEELAINKDNDRLSNLTLQSYAIYNFVSTNESLDAIKKQQLMPIMQGESGKAYLRVVDASRHNLPVVNYPVFIYEDSEGLYPVKRAYSDQWGMVDVTELEEGTYYWNMPNTVLLQPFKVKKDDGLLVVNDLKYSRQYMACEVGLPQGYDYDPSQEVCFNLTLDDNYGYVENVETMDVSALNKLRRLNAMVYKVDSQENQTLLNGAVFTVDDIYEEGLNLCDQYNCEGLMTPMVKTRKNLGTYMSGGIYIQEKHYQFINPFTYNQLLNAMNLQQVDAKVGNIITINDVDYKIVKVWLKDSDQQTIIVTDGNNEYTCSQDEKNQIVNYEYVPQEGVAYQFAYDPQFTHSMVATTNANGEIKFVPNIKDDYGNTIYKEGTWYYRKVELKETKQIIDPDNTTIEASKWLSDVDENGKPYYYVINKEISAVYPTKSQILRQGMIQLDNVLYGHDLLMCETQSPWGYLRDDVCAVFVPKTEYTLTNVNHYRSNSRIIKWRKVKKGYRTVLRRRLRYRQLGEFSPISDSALDWYNPSYLYDLANYKGEL